MVSGPKTTNWYVCPGRYKTFSAVNLGGGVYIFYFWNFDNDFVYTYGFAGVGIAKTSLKYAKLFGKEDGSDIGDWKAVDVKTPFGPEDLDGAPGRVVKVGLSLMGMGHVECRITAHRIATYFSASPVDIKNTGFAKLPASAMAGEWTLLDAEKQKSNKTMNWDAVVDGA